MSEKEQNDGLDMMMGLQGEADKAKDVKKTILQFLTYLAPYKIQLIIVVIFAIASTSFSVIGPRVMGRVTTILVDGIVANLLGTGLLTDFRQMGRLFWILVTLYILSAICNFIQEIIMARLAVKVTYKLREEISEKMHKLPINYYDTRSQGEILSRITNDIDMISQTLSTNLTQLITASTTIIGVLIMMFSISWLMTIATLIVIPISMWIMMLVLNKSHKFFSEQQKSIGKLNGLVEESYSSHTIVLAYNGEEDTREKFKEINKEVRRAGWKAQFLTNIVEPIFSFIGNIGYVLACVLGGWLVIERRIQ